MDTVLQDLRYALRTLARSPGFTLAAVVTIGLAIGANAAIFSVVDGVLLEPLDLPEQQELVTVWQDERVRGGPETEWTGQSVFSAWRERNQTLAGITVVTGWGPQISGGDRAEGLVGAAVSHEYFDVIGVTPVLGRGFLPEEEIAGQDLVVVLSHELWARRFASNPEIVGKTLPLDGETYTVVGVLPPGYQPPLVPGAEIWTAFAIDPAIQDWGSFYLRAIGRLRPGVSREAAQGDLLRITEDLGTTYPADLAGTGITVVPLHETVTGQVRTPLLALQGAVLLVLLIACANVANLFIARASSRDGEMAVRTALGAGRSRLARQLLTESLVLAVLGGALGLVLASGGLDLIRAYAPAQTPRLDRLELDGSVLLFTLLATLGSGLFFGLAPLGAIARTRLADSLQSGGRVGAGGSRSRLRSGLVVAELALGLALLVGAGLLIRSLDALGRVDPGFRSAGVVVGSVGLPPGRFPEPHQLSGFIDGVVARLEARGDVAAAGAVSVLPFSGSQTDTSFVIEGRIPPAGEEPPTDFRRATPGYFSALGIPLVVGRLIEPGDGPDSTLVVVINQQFADRFFPGQNPLGQRLRISDTRNPEAPWWQIVGVVGSVRDNALDQEADAELYLPNAQRPGRGMVLVARAASGAQVPADALRSAVAEVDAVQAVTQVGTLEDLVHASLGPARFVTGLLVAFALLALVLAAVGIYGVMAFAVGRRTREIGVRMALGAEPGSVLGMVLRQGAVLVAAGLTVGLFAAIALSRGLASLLYGIGPGDPSTFVGVSVVLAATALLATWLPARRAAKIDPVVALRSE